MKKIISLLLISVLLLSAVVPAFAEDTMTITLEEAIELAKKNSLVLKNFDSNILIAERNLKSAIYQADIVKTDGVISDSEYLENGKIKELYPAKQQRIVDDLLIEKEEAIKNIEIEVTNAYYSLYNEMLSLETQRDNLVVQQLELESKQQELSLGLITQNTVLDLENNIAQMELANDKAEWSIEMAQMDLAKTLGVDLNTKLILVEALDLSVSFEYDIEFLAEQSKTQGASVLEAEKDLEMKIFEKNVVNKYTRYKSPENSEDYDQSIVDLEKKLEDAKVTEEFNVRSDYNSILNAQLDLEIAKLKLEVAERIFQTNLVKSDLGMIVYLDVVKSQNAVDSAELDVLKKELNLYDLVETFNYSIQDFITKQNELEINE
ncbi:MAG: TolC family protein [Clostridiales bacterium]|nr:TolC family protein [Clostridiales bacterium]